MECGHDSSGQTNRNAVGSVLSSLKRVKANVIGVALNEVRKDMSDRYYYYGYYGKYYSKYYKPTKGSVVRHAEQRICAESGQALSPANRAAGPGGFVSIPVDMLLAAQRTVGRRKRLPTLCAQDFGPTSPGGATRQR